MYLDLHTVSFDSDACVYVYVPSFVSLMCLYVWCVCVCVCVCVCRKQVGDDGANSKGHSRLQSQERLRQGAIQFCIVAQSLTVCLCDCVFSVTVYSVARLHSNL